MNNKQPIFTEANQKNIWQKIKRDRSPINDKI